MSPHATPECPGLSQGDSCFFQKYSITQNGFLPATMPLKLLPDSYYTPWESIVQKLPERLRAGQLRKDVNELPLLSTNKLRGESEWRRAYVVLTFLAHAYIWGGENAAKILPSVVAVPLLEISRQLEVPPVATYASLNLWNFLSTTNDFTDLESLKCLHTFTGTEDESWFYLVSVAMEAEGARIIRDMLIALESVRARDYVTITLKLERLHTNIEKISILLERLHEHCDPTVFFNQIRPFLAGSRNMAAAGLPNGVFYEEGNGIGSWRQLRGGSNGQSSLIQFLDIILGVEHTSRGNHHAQHKMTGLNQDNPNANFHEEMRAYMPGPHRRFLEHVSRLGSIRELAKLAAANPEQQGLSKAYQTATRAMTELRNKHLQIVARYIIVPSMRANAGSKLDLASASRVGKQQLTGTGGTSLMPFLKQTRDETLQAGRLTQAQKEGIREE